jgi:hypothetical protein
MERVGKFSIIDFYLHNYMVILAEEPPRLAERHRMMSKTRIYCRLAKKTSHTGFMVKIGTAGKVFLLTNGWTRHH